MTDAAFSASRAAAVRGAKALLNAAPPGYVIRRRAGVRAIIREDAADAIAEILVWGTLHHFASDHPLRQELQGRRPVFAVPLADSGLRIVVRHNHHGGLLAPLTGDRFLAPTRAPLELDVSRRLAAAQVPTPSVVAIVRYPAGGPFERADVATEEVPDARDLATVMREAPDDHAAAADATAELLRALAGCGAVHADLNLKNVLLQRREGGFRAHVLDVDRVSFHDPRDPKVPARNWARFARSARKWREQHGVPIPDAWLARVQPAP